jgi:small neutral amino acid transporter SnatA (MarC family)
MSDLLANLIPFLLVDALNPVLFALMVVAVGTARPISNSSALLAGHTAAYFLSGIFIALGLEKITSRLQNPQPIDFFVELAIGLLCLWAALGARDGKASEERQPEAELSPAICFGYGAIINFIGVPFAVPYLAAIDQVLKANLTAGHSLQALAVYNVAYALPFLLVPLLVLVMGDASKPILQRVNQVLINVTDKVMPLLLLLLGSVLIVDAIKYLVTGDALW